MLIMKIVENFESKYKYGARVFSFHIFRFNGDSKEFNCNITVK